MIAIPLMLAIGAVAGTVLYKFDVDSFKGIGEPPDPDREAANKGKEFWPFEGERLVR